MKPIFPLLAVGLAGLLAGPASAQCDYYTVQIVTGQNCGILGPAPAWGQGIAENGFIAGFVHNCQSYERGFGWFGKAGLAIMPMPTGASSLSNAVGYDVNSSGAVVGVIDSNVTLRRGFIWHRGEMTLLDTLSGSGISEAYAISETGHVVGHANGRAVLWQDVTPISLLPTSYAYSEARGVNDYLQITGFFGAWGHEQLAFIWSDGEFIELKPIPGGVSSRGQAISNKGDICGWGHVPIGAGGALSARALAYVNGQMFNLGVMEPYQRSFAHGINNAGQVVGYFSDNVGPQSPIQPAFIWQNGVLRSLGDFLPPGSGLYLRDAYAINNAGQVTGSARLDDQTVAYILSPPQRIPADYNCDGTVDYQDLLGLLKEWGPSIPGVHADFNNDGLVNVDDLLTMLQNWSFN